MRPFAHHAAGEERWVLAVVNHREAERGAIVHHLAHQAGGGDGLAVVADGDNPGALHRGDFREGFAFTPHRSRANRPDSHGARGCGAFDDGAGNRGVVVYGLRVGHTADGGESSARGGLRAGLYRFGHFLAGLAQMAVEVYETGRDDQPLRVEDFRAIR